MVLGGDVAGKAVIPLVARGGGYVAEELGGEHIYGQSEVADLEKQIRDMGFYPARLSAQEFQRAKEDSAFVSELFLAVMQEELRSWLELAKQRLKGTSVQLYMMLGNDDEPALKRVIADSNVATDPEDEIIDLGEGLQMASCGWANITPWHSPRELPEEELKARLEISIQRLVDPARSVWNFHVPPLNTSIDRAPQLDDKLKPLVSGGSVILKSVGSAAVRALIDRHQPLLGLHGHIHEARGVARLGRTVCINPGSQYADGVLDGALVVLDQKRGIKHYQLVSG